MDHNRGGRRGAFALALMLALLSIYPSRTLAANDRVDDLIPGKTAQAQIVMSYTGEDEKPHPTGGVTVDLYRVAKLSVIGGGAHYTLVAPIADTGIDFAGMNAARSLEAAKQLAEVVGKKGIAPVTAVTDGEGIARFSDLEPGMYLAIQRAPFDNGKVRVEMAPCLWSFPQAVRSESDGQNTWNYEVSVVPKLSDVKPIPPVPTPPTPEKPKVPNVRTGDETAIKWAMAALGFGVVALVGLYWFNRRTKK